MRVKSTDGPGVGAGSAGSNICVGTAAAAVGHHPGAVMAGCTAARHSCGNPELFSGLGWFYLDKVFFVGYEFGLFLIPAWDSDSDSDPTPGCPGLGFGFISGV